MAPTSGEHPRSPIRFAGQLLALALLAALPGGCGPSASAPANPPEPAAPRLTLPIGTAEPTKAADEAPTIRFRDISSTAGVSFRHYGYDAEKRFPLNFGSGVAMLDYDADGHIDLYFGTTRNLPLSEPCRSGGNRLYRNNGDGTYRDVTDQAGVGFRGYTQGVCAGDINGDGLPDLFLTNYGPNVLYVNNGDGTFRDATAGSGLTGPHWSSGSAMFDYDADGHLDLYVSCYGTWKVEDKHPFCGDEKRNIRIFCSPFSITPTRHYLYRNRGDGTFEDVTESAGVLRRDGRGLGVVAGDFNRDGKTDIYVANDGCPKFLFLNRGDGTFDDAGDSTGAAVNEAGEVQASMGVDAEDIDDDGFPEFFATNFRGQYAALYRNHHGANFQDISARAGTIPESAPWVGWGCALADLDNDGRLDILFVNGEVDDNLKAMGQDIPFEEPAKVLRNVGDLRFRRVRDAGSFFAVDHVARGAAFGDLDNDGALDFAVNLLGREPALLRNESKLGRWIRLELLGRTSNRSAIGAVVEVHCGGRVLHRQLKGGGSYVSANDPRLLIGLGSAERVDRVEIRWPSGLHSTLEAPALGRSHQVREPAAATPARETRQ